MFAVNLAAGMHKDLADVKRSVTYPTTEETIGSTTWDKKAGNPEPAACFYEDSHTQWNAIGLKNPGAKYYREHLPTMAGLVRNASKKCIVSYSGKTPEENRDLSTLIAPYVDEDEFNTACPNVVVGNNGRAPLIGYRPELVRAHLEALNASGSDRPIRVKMPPFLDFFLLEDVADVIKEHTGRRISAIVTCNTLPNCLPLDPDGDQEISVGLAGGSGSTLFHSLALANARKWRQTLDTRIDVIGVGGIHAAHHAKNFERIGAVSCQIASAYWSAGGVRALNYILNGM